MEHFEKCLSQYFERCLNEMPEGREKKFLEYAMSIPQKRVKDIEDVRQRLQREFDDIRIRQEKRQE